MAKRKAGGGFKFASFGGRQVINNLKDLDKKVARQIVRKEVREGLKPVAEAVKARAPVGETGELQKNVKVRAAKGRKRGDIALEVRVGEGDFQGDQYYAAFVEYGTSKMDAKPFMRPAYDEKADDVADKTTRRIVDEIEAAAKRARKEWLSGDDR